MGGGLIGLTFGARELAFVIRFGPALWWFTSPDDPLTAFLATDFVDVPSGFA